MYFFEPNSYLMLREDEEGTLHIYKVVSVDDEKLVLCWVSTLRLPIWKGKTSLRFSRCSSIKTTPPIPLSTRHSTKSPEELNKALGDIEILE